MNDSDIEPGTFHNGSFVAKVTKDGRAVIPKKWWDEWDQEDLTEDVVKQGNSWVNKGKDGTHGKFKTKKAAEAQMRAMYANGYTG